MSNAVVSRIGQVNQAGDTDAIFLKVFPGLVLNAFEETNKFMPLHTVRNIASGKTAQFPATGIAAASYHTPGNEILGEAINHAEVTINIDQILLSHTFVADIDEAMNHYDVRSEYASILGRALALQADKNVLISGVLAARTATPTVTGLPAGTSIVAATSKTDGSVLAGAMFDAAEQLDENDVPEEDRYMAIAPAQYYLMAQTTNVINRDWGGRGAYSEGEVLKVAGINVVKTNNLPTANIGASPAGAANTYHGDFTNTTGLVFTPGAMGTVKLIELSVAKEYDLRRLGTLMLANYAMGHAPLRPECAVEIATS